MHNIRAKSSANTHIPELISATMCSKPGYLIFLLRTFVFLTPVKFVDSNLFK